MRKIDRLKSEARQGAKARGHKLRPFLQSISNKEAYATDCQYCDMGVVIKLNPQPNEIDISGEAIALSCTR